MLAARLASMPAQSERGNGGMPINVPHQIRAPWAHDLRKLGVFVIPELATHELVAAGEEAGMMRNHTPGEMRPISASTLMQRAREMNPELAKAYDAAKTPAEKRQMQTELFQKLSPQQRKIVEQVARTDPEVFTPR